MSLHLEACHSRGHPITREVQFHMSNEAMEAVVISANPLLLIQKYLPCFQMAVKEQGEGWGGRGSEEGAAGC